MDAYSAIFLVLAGVALIAALFVLLARNPVHSVLFMLLAFVNVAAMFVLMGAEFVAVIQVLVYSGAILVLFLFVVMLLQRGERPSPVLAGRPLQVPVAVLVGLTLIAELVVMITTSAVDGGRQGTDTTEAVAAKGGNIQALGEQLYTTWLLPFEIASVLLLVAAVGAVFLAREEL